MPYAPQQDWSLIEQQMRHEHARWLKSLSVDERRSILEDLHQLAGQIGGDFGQDARLTQRRWRKKMALHNKMLDAFVRLDRWLDARSPEANPG